MASCRRLKEEALFLKEGSFFLRGQKASSPWDNQNRDLLFLTEKT